MPSRAIRAIALVGLALSLYSIANGLHALGDWVFVDLLSEAANEQIKTGPQGWMAVVLVQFWPYVAIGVGVLGAWLYWLRLRHPEFRARKD